MDNWLLMGVLAGFGWVLAGLAIFKNQVLKIELKNLDINDVTKRLKLKEQYIADLEEEIEGYRAEIDDLQKESSSWQGKYHQKGQIKKLPSDKYDLTQTSDLGIVAEDIIDQIAPSLPGDIQQILSDPQIKGSIIKYANEHPDQAIDYIKRFIGAPGKKSGNTQSSLIPDFDKTKAI